MVPEIQVLISAIGIEIEFIKDEFENTEKILIDRNHKEKEETFPQVIEDKLLNIEEAAEYLDLAKSTVYSKISRGELPSMKRSKRVYFSKNELTNYLKEGRRKTNAELEKDAEDYMKKMGGSKWFIIIANQ